MNFIGLLKDLIGLVVIANTVTGQKNQSLSTDYVDALITIMKADSSSERR